MNNNLRTITTALDGKTAYFAELLARMQRKTLTRYVTDLISADLSEYEFNNELYSEHPADRFALLGGRMPQLLNTRQRILWQRVICADQRYWKVLLTVVPIEVNADTFNFPLLRESWAELNTNQDAVMKQADEMMANIQIRRTPKDKD